MNKKIGKQKRYFREIIKLGGTGRKQHFLGKTFSTKFFLKFCSDMLEPDFVCFQILNYEPENRTKEDIKKASPWLKTLKYFYNFISLEETEESCNSLINGITWVLYRKEYHKNKIIKRAGENNNFFYLVLDGSLQKLDLVVHREILSLEEYLIYLIKMKILNEKGIINKCKILNKSYVKIDGDNIKNFCKKNRINNYEFMKSRAISELNELGLNIPENYDENELNNNDYDFKSIDNFLKIFSFEVNAKRVHDQKKAYFNFYLPKYERNGDIKTGYYFGNLLEGETKENSAYIAETKSNIGILNKEKHYSEDLYQKMVNKNKKIFSELTNKFFIFHHIKEDIFINNYAPFMVYKRYFKGDKIFLQNSCYEGIYLVESGEVKISIDISIDDMYNLITYLTFALNGYNDYVSGFTSRDYINDQIKQQNIRIKSHNGLDHETVKLYLETNNYPLMTINEYNILGTNESFDHQTEIYNFSAECISDEAIIYFLPKENLNKIINKEKMVYNSLIQLVEFRIKNIIWKIKNYIKIFENKMTKFKAKRMKIKKNFYLITDNNNNNDNKIKTNSLKDISNRIQKNKIIFHNYSKPNFLKNNKYKNLFLSQDNNFNNDIIYTYRKSRNNNLQYTPKIPTINENKNNRINDYKNIINYKLSYSQTKKNIINTLPDGFPFLIMDSFVKRDYFQDWKLNIFHQIKTSNNIEPLKIKKIYLKNNNK